MPYDKQAIKIEFPFAGISKRFGTRGTPPFTTADAVNVRPDDNNEGRVRGGSRPGMLKKFAEQLGSGTRIQHLGQLNTVTDGETYEYDTFSQNAIDPKWSGGDSSVADPDQDNTGNDFLNGHVQCYLNPAIRGVQPKYLPDVDASEAWGEMLLRKIDDLDTSEPYTVSMVVKKPSATESSAQTYLFLGLDDDIAISATQNDARNNWDAKLTTGLIIQISYTSAGNASITYIEQVISGVSNSVFVDLTPPTWAVGASYEIQVTIDGTDLSVSVDGNTNLGSPSPISQPITITALTGTRMGFVLNAQGGTAQSDIDTACTRFSVDYTSNYVKNTNSRKLVAVAGGTFYVENNYGEMEADTSDVSLNTRVQLQGVTQLQKYYIADYGDDKANGTGASADNADPTVITVTGVDLTGLGIDVDQHVLEVSAGTSGLAGRNGLYEMASIALNGSDTEITMVGQITDGTAGTCSYRIARGPKVYDPTASAGSRMTHLLPSDVTALGSPPMGCKMVCRYNDRLTFAGDIYNPHLWYMARQGDPTDWQYVLVIPDEGQAVAGNNSSAGTIGEPITCMLQHDDDYLIWSGTRSMYVLLGDPAAGGRISNIAQNIGIIGTDAWCYGPNREVVFLTHDGIYTNASGVESPIQSVSREKLPRQLRNINPDTHHVTMSYDTLERGIHIMVSPFQSTGTSYHYFMIWPDQTFWSQDFHADRDPFCLFEYSPTEQDRGGMIMGGRDGYIREFTFDSLFDDGKEVKSIVMSSPFYLGGDSQMEGIVEQIIMDLAEISGDVVVNLIIDNNHEQVVAKAQAYIDEVLA